MEQTRMEQVAAQRGYPATLFGYGPSEGAYWMEPLGWVNELANAAHFGLDAGQAAAELAQLYAAEPITDNRMAPRFRRGTQVAGRLVGADYCPAVDDVLAWQAAGQNMLARIRKVLPTALLLGFDNGAEVFEWPWPLPAGWSVLHVTHYTRLPIPGYDGD